MNSACMAKFWWQGGNWKCSTSGFERICVYHDLCFIIQLKQARFVICLVMDGNSDVQLCQLNKWGRGPLGFRSKSKYISLTNWSFKSSSLTFFHYARWKLHQAAMLRLQKLSKRHESMPHGTPQNPGGPNNIKLFGSKPPICKKKSHWFSKLQKKTRGHRGSFEPTEPASQKYTKNRWSQEPRQFIAAYLQYLTLIRWAPTPTNYKWDCDPPRSLTSNAIYRDYKPI